ncbi:hypothetical protein K432DRAFT_407762 [Lepidopterella palustris CBS 459.81]|uniref:Antifreeze protein n=1 Tax=Lepidopterella palustris CBS 459.81 TaxID=1314670 RepID=A0A8E2E3T6_9PEZI|nr:hypothetical protein K432DRAFT_407762 [Lepidopterella palustris CBS 459.81]
MTHDHKIKMLTPKYTLMTLAALVSTIVAEACPPCYTHTTGGILNCPMIPVHTPACIEPQCVILSSTTIPGPNPACPTTPTITTYAACPTTATCRKGCEILTTTVSGTPYSCGVSWDTATPTTSADLSCENRDSTPSTATTTDFNLLL